MQGKAKNRHVVTKITALEKKLAAEVLEKREQTPLTQACKWAGTRGKPPEEQIEEMKKEIRAWLRQEMVAVENEKIKEMGMLKGQNDKHDAEIRRALNGV